MMSRKLFTAERTNQPKDRPSIGEPLKDYECVFCGSSAIEWRGNAIFCRGQCVRDFSWRVIRGGVNIGNYANGIMPNENLRKRLIDQINEPTGRHVVSRAMASEFIARKAQVLQSLIVKQLREQVPISKIVRWLRVEREWVEKIAREIRDEKPEVEKPFRYD